MAVQIEILLPPAPAQAAPQAKRVVTVTIAGASQPAVEVETASVVLPAFQADIAAPVQASVVEILANGKQSPPCVSPQIVPADHVEAVAADPAGFQFRVTPIP